ncbi:hypothetical protein ACIOJE_27320 [Kitasatospora sp. NPDC087861]|uniref:hypothetical protein n=1 Tax=Kitasatospora sp. NPDC087861 TaxID=3364070 RepID=UPI0038072419
MPDTPAAVQLAEAYTWYATGLRDLVLELLDEAGLDTASDTAEDLCGDLWLHAAEFTASHNLSFTEVLALLDRNADLLVNRLRYGPPVTPAGRLDTAPGTGTQLLPRSRRAAESPRPQRAAA